MTTTKQNGIEARLAMGLIAHLKVEGFTCYPELDRVDIVAKKDQEVLAIECKKDADLKVFAQAHRARQYANAVYVAFSAKSYYGNDGWAVNHFIRDVCRSMNMGCYTVSWDYHASKAWETWKPGDPVPKAKVTEIWRPQLTNRHKLDWDALMVPEAETFSVAGGSGVKAWTKIRLWELEVKKWVQENPGHTVGEILQALRPPGVHKKTGKPLVVHKQDQERLFYFIKNVFVGFRVEPAGIDFSTSKISLWDTHAY
jgi:hypothetical protein